MTRAKWKWSFYETEMIRYLEGERDNRVWRTYARRSMLPKQLTGSFIRVHCGKEMELVEVDPTNVNLRVGELVFTKSIGGTIHKFNRVAQKRKKAEQALRQAKLKRRLGVKKRKKAVKGGKRKKIK